MKIRDMVKHVNRLTGQGIYSVDDLLPYFDECIDEINVSISVNLPTVTSVYNNDFSKLEDEEDLTYVAPGYGTEDHEAVDNEYRRIHDSYIRNYICYEASYRILRDEDEDEEVYINRAMHARQWLRKIISNLGNFEMAVGDTIIVNGDVKDSHLDDYYNPYYPVDDE